MKAILALVVAGLIAASAILVVSDENPAPERIDVDTVMVRVSGFQAALLAQEEATACDYLTDDAKVRLVSLLAESTAVGEPEGLPPTCEAALAFGFRVVGPPDVARSRASMNSGRIDVEDGRHVTVTFSTGSMDLERVAGRWLIDRFGSEP